MRSIPESCPVLTVGRRGFSVIAEPGSLPVFVSFAAFPDFHGATEEQLRRVRRRNGNALHWPDLGITLSIDRVRKRLEVTDRRDAAA